MILRLAFRNIFRNRWRTGLTVAGITVGVTMLVWTLAYMEGFKADLIRGATQTSTGQIRVVTTAYIDQPTLENTFTLEKQYLERIDAIPGVANSTPRIMVNGLVGTEERSTVAQIVGVDPERDAKTMNISSSVVRGDWFKEPWQEEGARDVVIGIKLAKQLGVDVGGEVVTFFEAVDGSLGNDLLRVVGVVESGSTFIDRAGVFLRLRDAQMLAAVDDQVHVINIKVDEVIGSELLVPEISKILPASEGEGEVVAKHWGELNKQIYQLITVFDYANVIYYFFIYLIVALGLFNASRMSALERRREFAMMMAIGVPRNKLFWTVLLETVLISVIGALLGVIIGGAYSQYLAVNGLDMTAFTGGEDFAFNYMGVNFSKYLYFVVTPRILIEPIIYIIPVALLCGLWPATQAARTDILKAISNRN